MEEITVCERSILQDTTLSEAEVRHNYGVVVVAIKQANGEMAFNPEASTRLLANDILVVIGKNPDLQRLEQDCKGP